ncbi:transposable element Tc3 transposase [Trichonephila clavipes]|nr:transposable element Tc3 transposase [Trichonephila clavipes]
MRQRNCHHRHTKRNLLADPLKETVTENTYQNRDTDNHINNTVNTFISTYPTTYLDPVLPDEIITYIKKSSSKKHLELWFQQDGATCHTARATIDLLKDTFGDRLISRFGPVNWPPRSCDLTPLDYFLWGYVKSLVYADKPQTLDHLEDNIRRVIADIRPQMLEKVIENWTSRLDYILASHENDIEIALLPPGDHQLTDEDEGDENEVNSNEIIVKDVLESLEVRREDMYHPEPHTSSLFRQRREEKKLKNFSHFG